MNPHLKTRAVQKSLYINYIKRSVECLHTAKDALSKDAWNSVAICCIHSAIAACDAMCIYFLGKRHSGEDHNRAVSLFKQIKTEDNLHIKNAKRLSQLLRIKNMAEYEARLVHQSEAEKILKIMAPELRVKKSRSQTTLKSEGKNIDFTIRAEDATALRASFNTYFKSIMLANEILSNDY